MKLLNKFIFLGAPTIRTKCYLHYLKKYDLLPKKIYILDSKEQKVCIKKSNKLDFDPQILFDDLIKNIKSEIIYTNSDINKINVKSFFKSEKNKYIIYSGLPGVILNEKFFKEKLKILHVHGGLLPKYKGSTTFYYSILQEEKIGMSSILLDSKIDTGQIIIRKNFNLEYGIDIDYILDPYLRARVLIQTIKKIILNGKKKLHTKLKNNSSEPYFVIHPVLKYFALKKCKLI